MSRVFLADLVNPRLIFPKLHASNRRRLVQKLSGFAVGHAGLNEEAEKRAVFSRGDLTTFGIGRGLAIPHATVCGVSKLLGAFARMVTPVDFGAVDGRAADLVLPILAPAEDETIMRGTTATRP